jgi:hypothetical protein
VAKLRVAEASSFKLDPQNANAGTKRGLDLLDRSFSKFGGGRSAVADSEGVVRAGNKSFERAVEHGLKIIEVETTGDEYVVVKRKDLSGVEAKAYGIADNRASEASLLWDTDVLLELSQEGVPIHEFWFKDELPPGLIDDENAQKKGGAPDDEEGGNMLTVELKFDRATFEVFKEMCDKLSKKYQTELVADTVVAAFRELTVE